MAAWAYSDWVTKTDPSDRLTRLRLHIQEVSEAIQDVSGGGRSIGGVPHQYLEQLREDERKLDGIVAAKSGKKRRTRVRFTRPS